MSINKFGMKAREKSHMSEHAVVKLIKSVLRKLKFLNEAEEGYDAENKRLINLKTPIKSKDGVNKEYVDELVRTKTNEQGTLFMRYVNENIRIPHTILMLQINVNVVDNLGFCEIQPYEEHVYSIGFACAVAIKFTDFTADRVEIYMNDAAISKEMYENKKIFVEMKESSTIKFKKWITYNLELFHCELLIMGLQPM